MSEPEEKISLDFDAVERWTAIKCPLFDQLFRYALAATFSLQVLDHTTRLTKLSPCETTISKLDQKPHCHIASASLAFYKSMG